MGRNIYELPMERRQRLESQLQPKPCSEGWLAGLNFVLFQIQPESCHLEGGRDVLLQTSWPGVIIDFKALPGTVKQQHSGCVMDLGMAGTNGCL